MEKRKEIMRNVFHLSVLLCCWGVFVLPLEAATSTATLDARVFADAVVSFAEGSPAAKRKTNNSPDLVLGKPSHHQPSLTLGCGGVLVVRFTDNALIDVDGDDLYVFEIGPNIEPTKVDISVNGQDWLAIGNIAGATASLDIHPYIPSGQHFNYVRLTDLKQSCQSTTPGADITAIAAIGSANRYSFADTVLFDFDQAVLKDEAKHVLQQWLSDFHGNTGRLQIIGHTDQQGTFDYNVALSKQRAKAVAYFLHSKLAHTLTIETQGVGEAEPIDSANTEAAAAKNRRVEILYTTARATINDDEYH